jgi:FMN phosphatase YigB (HAD superfamily)
MSTYKNIIFDLGGVILNIDYQLTIDAFKKLGILDFEDRYSQAKQSPLFDALETGKISPAQFRDELREILNTKESDKALDKAWNALLLDFPSERLEVLKKVSKKYRTFLLSNTNEIHYQEYTNVLKREFGFKNLAPFFEKEYYSHQIGLRKPNSEVFEYVLNGNNLQAHETLFIDDSYQHIEAAQKIGLQTIWLQKGRTIEDVFKDYKL